MNVQSVNEDEDFPVFRAGPPIPLRTKSGSVKPKRKIKTGPLKATASSSTASALPLVAGGGNNGHFPPHCSSSVLNAESKVKKYIERVKASDELGRKKRIKPEQMLSLEELYQVGSSAPQPESAKSQEDHDKSNNTSGVVATTSKPQELSINQVQDKLRATLRIVKEKDELINKLRESCHDLAIKCADTENRMDELRFSFGRLPTSVSSFCIGGGESQNKEPVSYGGDEGDISNQHKYSGINLRRCASHEGLQTCGVANTGILNDGAVKEVAKQDVQTQIDGSLCQDERNNETSSEQEVGHWRDDDDILQETCSNWIEKVQNWKTDSNFNLSQDSGGDRDSGFRGSAEIDIESVRRKQRHCSLPRSRRKCQEHHLPGERSLKVPASRLLSAQIPQMSSSSTTTITGATQAIQIPPDQCGKPSNPNTTSNREVVEEMDPEPSQQHFWPSYSSSSHSNLNHLCQTENLSSTKAKSLFYEMAEADRNKYSYFQEEGCCSAKHRDRTRHHHHNRHHYHHHHRRHLHGAKSLDTLYFPQQTSHPTSEELRSLIDSSLDPPESILKSHLNARQRSMDNTVKMLDPLLDDTTQIALRVQRKTERLAKMLQDACTFE